MFLQYKLSAYNNEKSILAIVQAKAMQRLISLHGKGPFFFFCAV